MIYSTEHKYLIKKVNIFFETNLDYDTLAGIIAYCNKVIQKYCIFDNCYRPFEDIPDISSTMLCQFPEITKIESEKVDSYISLDLYENCEYAATEQEEKLANLYFNRHRIDLAYILDKFSTAFEEVLVNYKDIASRPICIEQRRLYRILDGFSSVAFFFEKLLNSKKLRLKKKEREELSLKVNQYSNVLHHHIDWIKNEQDEFETDVFERSCDDFFALFDDLSGLVMNSNNNYLQNKLRVISEKLKKPLQIDDEIPDDLPF